MKLGFVLRRDARTKGGGDVNQAEAYARLLEKNGCEICRAYGTYPKEEGLQALVVFNIDRPIDNLAAMREAKRRGIPIVLVPIHHPRRHMDEYQRTRSSVWERRMRWWVRSYHRWEVMKDAVRVVRGAAPWSGWWREALIGQLAVQRWMVEASSGFIFIAHGEQRLMEEEIAPVRAPAIIIQNGFELRASSGAEDRKAWFDFRSKQERFALMVGRIEPRKNQLGVIDALQDTGIPVCFVGAENPHHRGYAKVFRERVARCPQHLYLGPVKPDLMPSVYGAAWVHVSASWFEVSPLVDIEARCCGCHVVATCRSYVLDYAGDFVTVCDPGVPATIANTVRKAMASPRPGLPDAAFLQRFSWSNVEGKLNQFFRGIVDRKG